MPALTALITGASSGIGEATARRLAREPGAALILVARREDRLRALADELPCEVTYVAVDITDADAPERIRAHVGEHHGRLDLLVNNAGASWRATFADGGYDNVRRTMELNFDAVVRLTEALLPILRESAPSSIVNVASTAGRVARAGTGAYSASKFALAGWSDALHLEEKANGVHVGVVLPGFISTEGFPQKELTGSGADEVARLDRRERRRGDLRRRAGRAGRALRPAPVLARRRRADRLPGPRPARSRRRGGEGDDDRDGGRRGRPR